MSVLGIRGFHKALRWAEEIKMTEREDREFRDIAKLDNAIESNKASFRLHSEHAIEVKYSLIRWAREAARYSIVPDGRAFYQERWNRIMG